jgi:hypothetical protein
MTKPREPSLLARMTGRRPAARREPEPADLGTAFGMEEWLSTPQGLQQTVQPADAPAKPAGSGWRLRWLTRPATR